METNTRRKARLNLTASLLAVLVALACAPALAKETEKPTPLLQADSMAYDDESGVITATGNVEVAMGRQVVRADKVTYTKATDVVVATGHVALTEANGPILYAEKMELTSDVKQGFIDKVGMLFPDNSRLVALDAQRYEGRYLIADHGVYSSCNLCESDPSKPPLWQMKGSRITHDSEKKDVIYRDATLEFSGIPVFYTPYFSHPDSTVKRRQGFLAPSGGMDKTLGTFARTPYYIDIAPNSDLVVTPTFSTTDKAQLDAEWRHRFVYGDMKWDGSFTQADLIDEDGVDKGQTFRGHLFGTTRFDLSNTWRAGTNIALTTDKSYLKRYSIASDDVLVNRAYAERFKGRSYTAVNTYYFEDLRPGDQLAEPVVAPELRYSAFGEPNKTLGGRWSLNSSLLVTSRSRDVALDQQGPSTRRLSVDTGWERQFVSQTGFLTTVSAQARADGYWADNVPDPNVALGSSFSSVTRTRPFAQGNVSLRYPLGRNGDGYQQILEPIAVLSAAPRVAQSTLLPNEDSIDTEFDETNLFSPNRFTGTDKVEGGTRIAYGLRHALISNSGAKLDMVAGQVFRTKQDDSFDETTGLSRRLSDYVGRLDLVPAPWASVSYGFRIDQHDLDFSRQELQAAVGPSLFQPFANFLSVEKYDSSTNVVEQLEEVTFGFNSSFAKYWHIGASHREALDPEPGARDSGINLTYQDECFTTGITAKKDYTNRLDVKAGESILFRFYLKNIGGLSTE